MENTENVKVHICHRCFNIWIKTRPFVCDTCRANVFIKEHIATPGDIKAFKNDNRFRVLEGIGTLS